MKRRLEADAFPAYGDKFIDAITPADIRELMVKVAGRDAKDVAKRLQQTTGQIFRYAIAHGIANRNPATDFEPSDILGERKVKHFARVDRKDLPELLVKMETYNGDALTRLCKPVK